MMRLELSIIIGKTLLILAITGCWEATALDCYVCKDCDLTFNNTHVKTCEEYEVRCVKREMITGEVERSCGVVEDCKFGGGDEKNSKKIGSATNPNRANRPRRVVRQLLQSSIKKDDSANIVTEFTSLNCCSDSECNGAFSSMKLTHLTAVSLSLLPCSIIMLSKYLTQLVRV